MKDKSYDLLTSKITLMLFDKQLDETIEEKIAFLQDILLFLEGHQKRNKGYELRKGIDRRK